MKKFFVGFTFLATAVLTAGELPREIPGPDHGFCQVNKIFEHIQAGGRCVANEYMTGIESMNPMRIWCAQAQVTCQHEAAKISDESDGFK